MVDPNFADRLMTHYRLLTALRLAVFAHDHAARAFHAARWQRDDGPLSTEDNELLGTLLQARACLDQAKAAVMEFERNNQELARRLLSVVTRTESKAPLN